MALNAARDTRLYPVTSPYYGSKGPDFTRRFWPDFIGGLGAHKDKFSNLRKHYYGLDPGGTPAATVANPNPARVPHNGTATLREESQSAFENRSDELISLMRQHIECVHLRGIIDAMVIKGNGGPVLMSEYI